ncbi:MAG TPA: hypothetical protein VF260_11425 [Bacilli bacterium]
MTRYWYSLVLIVFTVFSIGAYYVYAVGDRPPEFILQKQSGDEREALAVRLQGTYYNQWVTIDSQGSEYMNERPYFAQLVHPFYDSPEIARLIREHRSFMRGKARFPEVYFENDRLVAYAYQKQMSANISGYNRFTIAKLDKKSSATFSYDADLPHKENYNGVYVQDVQAIGDMLKVATLNYTITGKQEYHLYSFGLKEAKAPSDQLLMSFTNDGNTRHSQIQIAVNDKTGPSRYLVYGFAQFESGDGRMSEQADGTELRIFDMETGAEVQPDAAAIANLLAGDAKPGLFPGISGIQLDGANLYLTAQNSQGIRLIRYGLDDATVSYLDIPVTGAQDTRIGNARLYMLLRSAETDMPAVAVADLRTGEILYRGEIAPRKPGEIVPERLLPSLAAIAQR